MAALWILGAAFLAGWFWFVERKSNAEVARLFKHQNGWIALVGVCALWPIIIVRILLGIEDLE